MTPTKMRIMGLVGLLGGLMTPARAQTPDGVPPAPSRTKVLVLGFYEDNHLDPGRRKQVGDAIINEKLGTALQPGLPEKDLSCLKASCLEDLAKQWNNSDYIMGGAILAVSPAMHEIQVWLYKIVPTEEEKRNHVPRQFSKRKTCPAEPRVPCLTTAVQELIKEHPLLEQLTDPFTGPADSSSPGGELAPSSTTLTPPDGRGSRSDLVIAGGSRPSCAKWNFARAATLGAAVGVAASGLIGGLIVAAFPDQPAPFIFTGRGYSAIGFGAMALSLIPGGLALGQPDLFGVSGAQDAAGSCATLPRSRWTAARGGAVGVFSGLLLSGLLASITVSASSQNTCFSGHDINGSPVILPCNFSPYIQAGWSITGAWALGLTLSLAIPSLAGSP